jgi:hypothetical protein
VLLQHELVRGLHWAPVASTQPGWQHGSTEAHTVGSLDPQSHSSPASTTRFPHVLEGMSMKHGSDAPAPALVVIIVEMDERLQVENLLLFGLLALVANGNMRNWVSRVSHGR